MIRRTWEVVGEPSTRGVTVSWVERDNLREILGPTYCGNVLERSVSYFFLWGSRKSYGASDAESRQEHVFPSVGRVVAETLIVWPNTVVAGREEQCDSTSTETSILLTDALRVVLGHGLLIVSVARGDDLRDDTIIKAQDIVDPSRGSGQQIGATLMSNAKISSQMDASVILTRGMARWCL